VFGTFATTLAVLLFVAVAADAGLDTYCSGCVARDNSTEAAYANGLNLMTSASAALVETGLLALVALAWHLPGALAALPIYVLAERRLSFRLTNLIALRKPAAGVIPITLGRILSFAGLAALLSFSTLSPPLLFAATGLAGALASLALLRGQQRVGLEFPGGARARQLLAGSRPLWTATMSGQLRNLDVVVVGALGTSLAAAVYALPARAVSPMRLIGTSVAAVAFPMAAREERDALRHLNRRLTVLALIALVVTAVMWRWAPDLAALVAGERYRRSGEIIRIFMIGVALNLLGSLISSELQGFGDSHFVARMGIALVVIFYCALALGVWVAGAYGAAWGTTVAFGIQLIVVAWRLRAKGYLR
jgi:O-antigen/teichoic acid export membrane protein